MARTNHRGRGPDGISFRSDGGPGIIPFLFLSFLCWGFWEALFWAVSHLKVSIQ